MSDMPLPAGMLSNQELVEEYCAGDNDAESSLRIMWGMDSSQNLLTSKKTLEGMVRDAAERQKTAAAAADGAAARVLAEFEAAKEEMADATREVWNEIDESNDDRPLIESPGWNEEEWDNYDPDEQQANAELPSTLVVGRVATKLVEDGPSVPYVAPFIGHRKTLVLHSCGSEDRDLAMGNLESLVWRIATALPNQVQFLFIDPHNSGNAFKWANRLPGRIENTELYRDLENAERTFQRISRNYLGGTVQSFEDIPANQRRREKLQIVVVADFPHGFTNDSRSLEILRRIANNGMEGGTYLLLHWNTDAEYPRGFEMDNTGIQAFKYAYYPLEVPDEFTDNDWMLYVDGGPSPELQAELLRKLSQTGAIRTELSFSDVIGLAPASWWSESAAERIVTPVGTRGSDDDQLRILLGETEDGQPCVHGVIGAGTGMGKSNLFHVFILGLAMRYSPEQVRFYLVDGKDGVEFRTYRHLPHAEVLSLNTAPQLARSLLADLVQEMERRNGIFRRNRVSGYKDYAALRRDKPELPAMPRLVLVVDEYQELFDGDREGEASKYLAQIGAQGRSAGIHMLLASQRFGASGMLRRDEIFSQIALRIAMKIAQADVATLTEFQRGGKDAINALDGPGKVVINDRSGQDGHNVSGIISLMKGPDRERIVKDLTTRAASTPEGAHAPMVFEGLSQPRLLDNPRLAALAALPKAPQPEELERFVKRPVFEGGAGLTEWYAAEQPRIAWVGQEFNVRGHAALVFKRKTGDNVALVGNNPNARHGMLLGVLTSLALNLEAGHTRFVLIDRTPRGSPWEKIAPDWCRDVAAPAGLEHEIATETGEIEALFARLETELDTRKGLDDRGRAERPSVFIALLDPERLDLLARQMDSYGVPTDSPSGSRLRRLFTEGPTLGMHVLLSTGTGRALGALIDLRKGLAQFRYRLLLQVSDDESFDLTGKRTAAQLQAEGDIPVCALLSDAETGAQVRFKPYVAASSETGDDENPGVLGELPDLAATLKRWRSAGR